MSKDEKIYKFEVSHKTIIFTIFFLLFLKFLLIILDLLFSLFIAFIITSALRPALDKLTKLKIPRILAALLVYFSFLTILISLLSIIFPPLIKETIQLSSSLPIIIQQLTAGSSYSLFNWQSLFQYLPTATNQIFNLISSFFSNAIWLLSTLFFSFYFLVEENAIKKILANFFAEEKTQRIINLINLLEKKVNNWFWGEVILMFVVGLLTYISLTLIGIKYALPLAVLAGLLEVVPNIGPTIAAIPAILVGFSQSTFTGISALALAILVQQLENNLIVPLVMKKAVGLNPIITLMALIIGGKLAGILGVLLSVPTVIIIQTTFFEFFNKK